MRPALLILLLVAGPSQDEAARAREILRAAGRRLQDLKTLKAVAEWTQEGVGTRHSHVIHLKRPELWRIDVTRGRMEQSFIDDGREVWSWMKTAKQYSGNMDRKHTLMGVGGPLAQLFLAPDASLLLERTSDLRLGRETVDGRTYDVVRYRLGMVVSDAEVWVDEERKVRKFVRFDKVGGDVNPEVFRRTLEYLTEEHDPELDPGLFVFEPPPDAMELGGPRDRDGSLLQEGSDAQDVQAVDLAGKKVKLSDFKGKPVALLFWNEKAEGAAEALAAFDRLRQAHKDAVFLAVDHGGSVASLKAHLQKAKLGVRVLRQKTDELSQAFGIRRYPTTYLLSGDRRVVLRHGGFYEDRLRKALEALAPAK